MGGAAFVSVDVLLRALENIQTNLTMLLQMWNGFTKHHQGHLFICFFKNNKFILIKEQNKETKENALPTILILIIFSFSVEAVTAIFEMGTCIYKGEEQNQCYIARNYILLRPT